MEFHLLLSIPLKFPKYEVAKKNKITPENKRKSLSVPILKESAADTEVEVNEVNKRKTGPKRTV